MRMRMLIGLMCFLWASLGLASEPNHADFTLPAEGFALRTKATTSLGESKKKAVSTKHHILYFLSRQGKQFVLVNMGSRHGLIAAGLLRVYRIKGQAESGTPVETGTLKIVEVGAEQSIAEVLIDSTPLSQATFTAYPGVMAGDLIEKYTYVVRKVQHAVADVALSFQELFKEPQTQPASYELSEEGKRRLQEVAMAFADKRLSLLFIKGFTDYQGPSEANQVESYQRALTVKQFLVNQMGFDKDRIVAIGMGEAAPYNNSQVPGFIADNRRIILEASHEPED